MLTWLLNFFQKFLDLTLNLHHNLSFWQSCIQTQTYVGIEMSLSTKSFSPVWCKRWNLSSNSRGSPKRIQGSHIYTMFYMPMPWPWRWLTVRVTCGVLLWPIPPYMILGSTSKGFMQECMKGIPWKLWLSEGDMPTKGCGFDVSPGLLSLNLDQHWPIGKEHQWHLANSKIPVPKRFLPNWQEKRGA